MKTTGAMGEIVGLASALCVEEACLPRDVYAQHLDDLKRSMEIGAGLIAVQHADADGAFVLEARHAKVRGEPLRYEGDRDCIGYWRSTDAYVEWSIDVPSSGVYSVEMLSSCIDAEAGGVFTVRIGDGICTGVVGSTGDWTMYAWSEVGVLRLEAGEHRLVMRGEKADGPLMKLRRVRLVELD